jgi:hypothetical protein
MRRATLLTLLCAACATTVSSARRLVTQVGDQAAHALCALTACRQGACRLWSTCFVGTTRMSRECLAGSLGGPLSTHVNGQNRGDGYRSAGKPLARAFQPDQGKHAVLFEPSRRIRKSL